MILLFGEIAQAGGDLSSTALAAETSTPMPKSSILSLPCPPDALDAAVRDEIRSFAFTHSVRAKLPGPRRVAWKAGPPVQRSPSKIFQDDDQHLLVHALIRIHYLNFWESLALP